MDRTRGRERENYQFFNSVRLYLIDDFTFLKLKQNLPLLTNHDMHAS